MMLKSCMKLVAFSLVSCGILVRYGHTGFFKAIIGFSVRINISWEAVMFSIIVFIRDYGTLPVYKLGF